MKGFPALCVWNREWIPLLASRYFNVWELDQNQVLFHVERHWSWLIILVNYNCSSWAAKLLLTETLWNSSEAPATNSRQLRTVKVLVLTAEGTVCILPLFLLSLSIFHISCEFSCNSSIFCKLLSLLLPALVYPLKCLFFFLENIGFAFKAFQRKQIKQKKSWEEKNGI